MGLSIDGRLIEYGIRTASDYLKIVMKLKDYEVDKFVETKHEIYKLINQILAIKQSCFMLRRTSHSCGSLSDDLLDLKHRLINELENIYNFIFDDEAVEGYRIVIEDDCSLDFHNEELKKIINSEQKYIFHIK